MTSMETILNWTSLTDEGKEILLGTKITKGLSREQAHILNAMLAVTTRRIIGFEKGRQPNNLWSMLLSIALTVESNVSWRAQRSNTTCFEERWAGFFWTMCMWYIYINLQIRDSAEWTTKGRRMQSHHERSPQPLATWTSLWAPPPPLFFYF